MQDGQEKNMIRDEVVADIMRKLPFISARDTERELKYAIDKFYEKWYIQNYIVDDEKGETY